MRLDFETDAAEQIDSAAVDGLDDFNFSDVSSAVDCSQKIRAGIKAVREGRRSEARRLLLQAAEAEPDNEDVWLNLASVSEYPEELLVFLNNALRINPANGRARDWEKATETLLAESFAARGGSTVEFFDEKRETRSEGFSNFDCEKETAFSSTNTLKKREAEQHFERAVAEVFAVDFDAAAETLDEIFALAPETENAWLLKSFLTVSLAEKAECWETVLLLNPENELARAGTDFLRFLKSKLSAPARENKEIRHASDAFDSEESRFFAETAEAGRPIDSRNIYAAYSTAEDSGAESHASDGAPADELSAGKANLPAYYEIEEVSSVSNFFAGGEKNDDGETSPGKVSCPFCLHENELQAFVCPSCMAVLTLSDLEMLLAHTDANREIVRQAVERMEAGFSACGADELKVLGIGQINLKNLRQGFSYLQQAAKSNPADVVLSSQIKRLAIRLAEIEAREKTVSAARKNKTILVVDDSATVRNLISSKLEKAGHAVLCAVDGVDALEKIEASAPDLILLDIAMPRMDGYQVCKMIRTNEKTKDIPVVMISGKDGFFDKVRGRIAGTTGYITKPFGPETLMKTVESYIV